MEKSHSWTIITENLAEKTLDKSSFKYGLSVIPKDIKHFFNVENLNLGDKKYVILHYNYLKYKAYINVTAPNRPITRIHWGMKFANLLIEKFPVYFQKVNNDIEPDNPIKMIFKRLRKQNEYEIGFCNEYEENDDFYSFLVDNTIFQEGKKLIREHYVRERNPKIIKEAIEIYKTRNGKVFCEVCGFDFEKIYGYRGKDFIEGHHKVPLSELNQSGDVTTVDDIALLCANCHRILHRFKPWLEVNELKEIMEMNCKKKK